MKTKAIIFDLDDTLIDTRKRHFKIVVDFLYKYGKLLNFEEYLDMRKRNKWSNKELIKNVYSLNEEEFISFWILSIEDPTYLKYDFEIVNCKLLNEIKMKGPYDFILLSLRSNLNSAEDQFKKLCCSLFFDKHHFLKHAPLNPKIEKLKMYKEIYNNVIFISDSMEDFNAAAKARVEFVGVNSGVYDIICNNHYIDVNSFLLKQKNYAY